MPRENARSHRRPWRIVLTITGGVIVVALLAGILSPWPAALLIRGLFEKGAADAIEKMEPYAPTSGIETRSNVSYGSADTDRFNWFSPSGTSTALPVVVWIHGGAWISGAKEDVDPYLRILASRGFTTVSLDYRISPEETYPYALRQINSALSFLTAHAGEYRIDPSRIVLAGDSAGAQLASQIATLTTNPSYAETVGIDPAVNAAQVRGVVLNCGIYDLSGIPDAPGIGGWGFRLALWAYLGEKDWATTAGARQMSTIDYVTGDFPATWISGGNADPLTATQSQPLAAKLSDLGVPLTTVFYEVDHVPSLGHEYQFDLDLEDARIALESTVTFLAGVTR